MAFDSGEGLVGIEMVQLGGDRVDDTARTRDVVRDPEDAPLVQQIGDLGRVELVVGRSDHGTAAQIPHDPLGEHAAEGGGDQNVDVHGDDLFGVAPGGAEFVSELLLGEIDVGDGQFDLDQLHAFLLDRLSKRKEIVGFRTSVVYQQVQKPFPARLPAPVNT
jgi:hypothetical protein